MSPSRFRILTEQREGDDPERTVHAPPERGRQFLDLREEDFADRRREAAAKCIKSVAPEPLPNTSPTRY